MNAITQQVIVVVDDDPPVRVALSRVLGTAGFGVETCASGKELLRMLATRSIDCIVLDLHMPEMDGFEVLKRMDEADMHIPVVVLTGYDTSEVRQRVLEVGICHYITKPVQRQVILQAIESAIGDSQDALNG